MKMTHKPIQTEANTDKLYETKQNQHYSPIKKNKRDLGIRFEPFPLLEFSPPLERCSDIYTGRNPSFLCFVYPIFSYFFNLRVFSLYNRSVISALNTQHHSKTRPLTADWLQVCFGTWSDTVVKCVFPKIASCTFNFKLTLSGKKVQKRSLEQYLFKRD